MKKPLLILLLILSAGACAFCFTHFRKQQERGGVLLDTMPELVWLRSELKLSDDQFRKVSGLHAAYQPKCVEMCARIARAHRRLETLAREGTSLNPELEAALKEHAAVHLECRQAMLNHIYQTSAQLDRKQSARYLEAVLPYALDFSRSEPDRSRGNQEATHDGALRF
ncbi:MAG: hypothetical protein JWM59_3133 [Verrucomicrobiales bacterium]|nr:hypothetical protein [Verrucomicrobiales bacterium]